ncbi:MAG: TIGR02300 family protein [Alphaproteobacteria bacterium]
MAAKNALGIKRICIECSTKFYDLNKNPITCPKCSASFQVDDIKKAKRATIPEKEEIEIEIEEDTVVADEDVLEDTSDLEDDNLTSISVEE